ncbi:DUF2188 domain-containing protein [Microbacterium sp. JZ101]
MTGTHVETFAKRGQWISRVAGDSELSQSSASREEAIEAGRALAERLGVPHRVVDSEPTGVASDEQSGADAAEVADEMLPDTTDERGLPLDNPSG